MCGGPDEEGARPVRLARTVTGEKAGNQMRRPVPVAAQGRAVHGLETLVLEDGARAELGGVPVHLAPLPASFVADALSLGTLLRLDLHAGRAGRNVFGPPPAENNGIR